MPADQPTRRRLNLTTQQAAALEWLALSSSWVTGAQRLPSAIYSLRLYHPTLADTAEGRFGPRGGRRWRARLTEAGREAAAMLAGDDDAH